MHFWDTWHHSISNLFKPLNLVATKDNELSVKFSQ